MSLAPTLKQTSIGLSRKLIPIQKAVFPGVKKSTSTIRAFSVATTMSAWNNSMSAAEIKEAKNKVALPASLKATIRGADKAKPAVPEEELLLKEFQDFAEDAHEKGVRDEVYLLVLTAFLIGKDLPSGLPALYKFASTRPPAQDKPKLEHKAFIAGFMREVGLKCIAFIGIPRVINALAVLSKAIDADEGVREKLPTESRRNITSANVSEVQSRGNDLWEDIYTPHHTKLLSILGHSHPDLPTHILQSHYSALLPPLPVSVQLPTDLDRELTSVLAIVSLRCQQKSGVERQLESHVYGLRKASFSEKANWISSEEGCVWLLDRVDKLAATFSKGA